LAQALLACFEVVPAKQQDYTTVHTAYPTDKMQTPSRQAERTP